MINENKQFNLSSVCGRLVSHYSNLKVNKGWSKYPIKIYNST